MNVKRRKKLRYNSCHTPSSSFRRKNIMLSFLNENESESEYGTVEYSEWRCDSFTTGSASCLASHSPVQLIDLCMLCAIPGVGCHLLVIPKVSGIQASVVLIVYKVSEKLFALCTLCMVPS